MKFKYAITIVVIMLAFTPLFADDNIWRLVFRIACIVIFFTLAILAWRQHDKNAVIAYAFLIVVYAIQLFDKEDKYFFVQIILLIIMLILAIIKWMKSDNKNGIG